jgi:transposase
VLAFFSRIPRCVVGLEACATGHYWARELRALGHEVRLMPAQYVKAYIKRNKHDAADAEAICEAAVVLLADLNSRRKIKRGVTVPAPQGHRRDAELFTNLWVRDEFVRFNF